VNRLATEFGLTLLPLDAILTRQAKVDTATALAAEGVHPTLLGHQIIANAWLDLAGIA
jgi:lysophospholipase L1-like esterase